MKAGVRVRVLREPADRARQLKPLPPASPKSLQLTFLLSPCPLLALPLRLLGGCARSIRAAVRLQAILTNVCPLLQADICALATFCKLGTNLSTIQSVSMRLPWCHLLLSLLLLLWLLLLRTPRLRLLIRPCCLHLLLLAFREPNSLSCLCGRTGESAPDVAVVPTCGLDAAFESVGSILIDHRVPGSTTSTSQERDCKIADHPVPVLVVLSCILENTVPGTMWVERDP